MTSEEHFRASRFPRRFVRGCGWGVLLLLLWSISGSHPLVSQEPTLEPVEQAPAEEAEPEAAPVETIKARMTGKFKPRPPAAPAEETPAEETPFEEARGESGEAPRPADTPSEDAKPRPGFLSRAAEVETRPGHHSVRSLRLLVDGGGRVDGARQGGWIAYDQLGTDGRYDIHRLRADVESPAPVCITCERYDFRKVSAYNPTWHPSGEWLVLQVQTSARRRHLDVRHQAGPYRSLGSELWIIDTEGKGFWQITNTADRGGAVMDPYFSFEADRLIWSQRMTNQEKPWGEWAVQVARLEIGRQPKLGKVERHQPTRGLIFASGFAPDDRSLLVSAAVGPGLMEEGLDIFRYDLEAGRLEPLTNSPDQRDGAITAVPRSDFYVWVTDRGLGGMASSGRMPWRGDLWLRSLSGERQERLTYFNDPRSDHYRGETLIDDLSWTSDGKLLFHVVSLLDEYGEPTLDAAKPVFEGIYILDLSEDLER